MSVHPDVPVTIVPKYARFSRRFRGIMLDWMILMAILFGALMLKRIRVEERALSASGR